MFVAQILPAWCLGVEKFGVFSWVHGAQIVFVLSNFRCKAEAEKWRNANELCFLLTC